jgi:hypothetical protein
MGRSSAIDEYEIKVPVKSAMLESVVKQHHIVIGAIVQVSGDGLKSIGPGDDA